MDSAENSAGDGRENPVVLFDGVCNLCNGFVQFLIENDADGTLRFASLQSEAGEALLREFDVSTERMDTIVLVEDGECYTESDAALRIAAHLGGVYRFSTVLRYVPRFVRDRVYMMVSRNRYDWFGQKDSCMMPTPENQSRFLTDSDVEN